MYIAIQGQDIFKQRNIYHTERPKYHRLVVYFGRRADKMVQILNWHWMGSVEFSYILSFGFLGRLLSTEYLPHVVPN